MRRVRIRIGTETDLRELSTPCDVYAAQYVFTIMTLAQAKREPSRTWTKVGHGKDIYSHLKTELC